MERRLSCMPLTMAGKVVVVAELLILAGALSVDKEDGGYVGLFVIIDANIANDSSVIDSTQVLLREASSMLYHATRRHVYFKQATIVLPPSWPRMVRHRGVAVRQVPYHTLHRSGMRITVAARTSGEDYAFAIRAMNTRGCGQRGDHIEISQEALPKTSDSNALKTAAFLLVREWARFRYGVFDEFGQPGSDLHPALYCSKGKVMVTGCSTTKCMLRRPRGDACRIMPGCRFGAECGVQFRHNKDDDRGASIMSVFKSTHVLQFCDNRSHNAEAPNEHNWLCGGKSTWQVISESGDFKGLQPAVGASPLPPMFTIIQEDCRMGRRLVFVLGVSGKVESHMTNLKRAIGFLLNEELEDTTWVSLITFDGKHAVRHPLSPLDSATRTALLRQLEAMQPNRRLCSSCDVLTALRQVLASGPTNDAQGSTIIFATDSPIGLVNSGGDLIPLLHTQDALLHGIALSVETSPDLEVLATETGGTTFVALDLGGLSAALQHVLSRINDASSTTKSNTNFEMPEVGNAIRDGSILRNVQQLSATSLLVVYIDVYYTVIVKKFEEAIFTVHLKSGNYRVVNASVIATFDFPGQPLSTLSLVDTGLGVDERKDDGIYNALFTKFVGSGRCTVNVYAASTATSAFIGFTNAQEQRKYGKGAEPKRKFRIPVNELVAGAEVVNHHSDVVQAQMQSFPTGPFTVNQTHLSMRVEPDLFERDVPPGTVSRFTVSDDGLVHTDGRRIWTLTWFNGGDHGYEGTAASLELRYSTDLDKIHYDFGSCDLVDPSSDLVNGSLVPQPAYTLQRVDFVVPRSLTQKLQDSGAKRLVVFFNIRPTSSSGVVGKEYFVPRERTLCADPGPCLPTFADDNDDVHHTTSKATTTKPDATQATTSTKPASSTQHVEDLEGGQSNFAYVLALFIAGIVAIGICIGCAVAISNVNQEVTQAPTTGS